MIEKLTENPMVQSEPPWNWTGVDVLNFKNDDARLRQLVAMFPSKRSSDEEIAGYLIDLRARLQRWLHQDEFGPDRGRAGSVRRVPAVEIEALVICAVREHLNLSREIDDRSRIDAHVARVEVRPEELVIRLAEAPGADGQTGFDASIHVPWQKTISTRRREILLP
jgi:hypothetical protein